MKQAKLFILAFFITSRLFGQADISTWLCTVERDIKLKDTGKNPQSHLAYLLCKAAREGKITLYQTYDRELIDTALLHNVIKRLKYPINVEEADSVANNRLLDTLSSSNIIRVMEDWEYNSLLKKTTIQIRAIAPIAAVYGEDGSYRGYRNVFYIKYKDALPYILEYDKQHPKDAFFKLLWADMTN